MLSVWSALGEILTTQPEVQTWLGPPPSLAPSPETALLKAQRTQGSKADPGATDHHVIGNVRVKWERKGFLDLALGTKESSKHWWQA